MNSSATSPEGAGLAPWKRAPFDRFLDYLDQVHRLFDLSVHGIRMVSRHDAALEVLLRGHKDQHAGEPDSSSSQGLSAHNAAKLQAARTEAEFARLEVSSDFPKLRAHSLLDSWGALEVLIEDVLVTWLTNVPELLESDGVARIRIPFAEFQKLDDRERLQFLVQEMVREKKANLKAGVTRFEVILGIIGLDGEVEERLRRDLWEANQVRNAIAHRGAVVDRHLLKACPWIPARIGEPIPLGEAESARYETAIVEYATSIIVRVRHADKLPVDPPAHDPASG